MSKFWGKKSLNYTFFSVDLILFRTDVSEWPTNNIQRHLKMDQMNYRPKIKSFSTTAIVAWPNKKKVFFCKSVMWAQHGLAPPSLFFCFTLVSFCHSGHILAVDLSRPVPPVLLCPVDEGANSHSFHPQEQIEVSHSTLANHAALLLEALDDSAVWVLGMVYWHSRFDVKMWDYLSTELFHVWFDWCVSVFSRQHNPPSFGLFPFLFQKMEMKENSQMKVCIWFGFFFSLSGRMFWLSCISLCENSNLVCGASCLLCTLGLPRLHLFLTSWSVWILQVLHKAPIWARGLAD